MPEIRRSGYFLAAVLLIALVCSFVWKAPRAPRFERLPETIAPNHLLGFSGRPAPVSAVTLEALENAQLIDRQYTSSDGFSIDFALIGGSDRDELHDPRSCLIGEGARIDNDRVEALSGTPLKVRACDVIFGSDSASRADIIYLYFTKQGSISSATDIRVRLLSSALMFRQDQPIYFLRFMTPVPVEADDEDRRAIHCRLTGFASQMWRRIGPVLTSKVNHS